MRSNSLSETRLAKILMDWITASPFLSRTPLRPLNHRAGRESNRAGKRQERLVSYGLAQLRA
jgi:hypothetical protein